MDDFYDKVAEIRFTWRPVRRAPLWPAWRRPSLRERLRQSLPGLSCRAIYVGASVHQDQLYSVDLFHYPGFASLGRPPWSVSLRVLDLKGRAPDLAMLERDDELDYWRLALHRRVMTKRQAQAEAAQIMTELPYLMMEELL